MNTLLEIFKALGGVVFAIVAVIVAIIIGAFIIQSVRILFGDLLRNRRKVRALHAARKGGA